MLRNDLCRIVVEGKRDRNLPALGVDHRLGNDLRGNVSNRKVLQLNIDYGILRQRDPLAISD